LIDFLNGQVIGGGAVGLAIARQLAGRDGTSTVLIERNSSVGMLNNICYGLTINLLKGMETSSRNSEVSRSYNDASVNDLTQS
jgi:flavin-dependent dehydrogenase